MAKTITDFLLNSTAAQAGLWIQLVNNATGTAYVSTGATGSNGLFTIQSVPEGQYTLSTGVSNTGPWFVNNTAYIVPRDEPVFNVMDYGAKGDGVTDDTTAIQNALNVCRSAGGGTVFMPAGTYIVNLNVHPVNSARYVCLAVGANTILAGTGQATIIKLAANQTHGSDVENAADYVIYNYTDSSVGGDENITIRDLLVDGNNQNQTHNCGGIACERTRNWKCENVIVQNMRGTAQNTVNETFHFDAVLSSFPQWKQCIARNTTSLRINDGTINNGSANLASTAATFTVGDVGKYVTIAYGTSNTAMLTTSITAFVDAHNVTLATPAGNTITGTARFTYGWPTASGFSANSSTDPHWIDCIAYGMVVTNGFTIYGVSGGAKYSSCRSFLNGGNGFNSEVNDGLTYVDCLSGGIASGGNSPYPQSFGDFTTGSAVFTATTITDTTKNWLPNQWAGGEVYGLTTSNSNDRVMIVSNTATQITLQRAFFSTPANGSFWGIGGNLGNIQMGFQCTSDTDSGLSRNLYINCVARLNNNGMNITKANGARVVGGEFSDNYHGGIVVTASPNVEIVGVKAHRNQLQGLYTLNSNAIESTSLRIIGGDFSNNNQSLSSNLWEQCGISLSNSSTGTIIGARASDDQTSHTQQFGIRQNNTSTFYIDNCDCSGNAVAQVLDGSASPRYLTVRNTRGFNPVGIFTSQPAVPASGTPYTNTLGTDATVVIKGGVLTADIQVGGTNCGVVSVPVTLRVPAGQTITLTYSNAPTWVWSGD